jgi:hypothetical protein
MNELHYLGLGMCENSILESDFNGRDCEDEGWIQVAHNRFCKGVFGRNKAHVVFKYSREFIV